MSEPSFYLESLQSNKVFLQTLIVSEKVQFCLKAEIKSRTLNDNVFCVRTDKIIELIKRIVNMTTAFESTEPQIHTINTKLNNLETVLIEILPSSPLQSTEDKAISQFM